MPLIEREGLIATLQQIFEDVSEGEGHCVLLCGEAGSGKTALVKEFCLEQVVTCSIYRGNCDDLFTPRSLAPLYDVLWQVNRERWSFPPSHEDWSELFVSFFQELSSKSGSLLIVFEDIHWADKGTLDFIKFFVRRIDQLPCLFILTYRDNEVVTNRSLRNVLRQLPPDSYTRLEVPLLSKQAVIEMASEKGYNGEDVYKISGGNPFYVNEILASYSPGVPEKIKDSILDVYERQKQATKNGWEIWSIMPDGLEIELVPKIKSSWDMRYCFAIGVLTIDGGKVVFKHELYRRTIEESLSPIKRIELNKKMLELFLERFEAKGEIERILHYAKNANETGLVAKYAQKAARKAASTKSHKESSKLWLTAIEFSDANDTSQLAFFYDEFACECYLSNQINEAITCAEKVLNLRKENDDIDKTCESLCFLSRLWWIEGNNMKAENLAQQVIELLKDKRLSSSSKALASSHISQLRMFSDELVECIFWGEKAIVLAKDSGNDVALCGGLNAMGAAQMLDTSSGEKGIALLRQSLNTAIKNSYFEYAGYAYLSLASCAIRIKNYDLAGSTLKEGLLYCEEKGLTFWYFYLLSWKARMELEMCHWQEAWNIADFILSNESQPSVITIPALNVVVRIAMRRGEDLSGYLPELKAIPFSTLELQRIIPSMVTLLEFEWLSGEAVIEKEDMAHTLSLMQDGCIDTEKNEIEFWVKKAGRLIVNQNTINEAYDRSSTRKVVNATAFWERSGCTYEQALVIFDGNEKDKRKAIKIVQDLGAIVVCEKMKKEMKNLGIKNIPRGIRNSTRLNPAFLTDREMEILMLLKEELPNKKIAAQLYISAKTVDHHLSNILVKLDVHSRHKAVSKAVQLGILK